MSLIFTPERWRHIASHRDQIHATLLRRSDWPRNRPNGSPDTYAARRAWVQYITHDPDGKPTGHGRYVISEPVPDTPGDRKAVLFTVLYIDPVDVYSGGGLSRSLARACGFDTVKAMQTDWDRGHPRSPLALAAYFTVGEQRDRSKYLTSTREMRWGPGKKGGQPLGDYTTNPRKAVDSAPVLSKAELKELADSNRQRHERRIVDAQQRMQAESMSERMARIEAGGEEALAIVRRSVTGISQRTERAERRIA